MSEYQNRLQEAQERKDQQRADREARGGVLGALYAQAVHFEQAQAEGRAYRNRDKIPETLQEYADVYHKLTGQTPSTRTLSDWIQEFLYWQDEGLEAQDITTAYNASQSGQAFYVVRPGSLTNIAVAKKAERDKSGSWLEPDEGGGIYV